MKKTLMLLCFLLASFSYVAAQHVAKGKVVDADGNPLPTGLILSPAPHQLSLEPFTLRPFRFVQRDQLFDICLYTFKHTSGLFLPA